MLFLTIAQVVKVVPSKNAAVVTIIKGNTNGVVAYGFYGFNADILFAGLQNPLLFRVASDFSRR